MTNSNKRLKKMFSIMLMGILFFGNASCSKDADNNHPEEQLTEGVKLNISIENFAVVNPPAKASLNGGSNNNTVVSSQEFTSGVFNVVAELVASAPAVSAKAATSKTAASSFNPAVRFRTVVYDAVTGNYVGQETGLTSVTDQTLLGALNLVAGKKYTLVTYSLGSTTVDPPEVVPGGNIATDKIALTGMTGSLTDSDYMYAINENVTLLSSASTPVNIVLEHQFVKVNVVIENSAATGTYGQPGYIRGGYPLANNVTGATGTISDYSASKFNMADGLSDIGATTSYNTSISGIKADRDDPTGAITNTGYPVIICRNGPNTRVGKIKFAPGQIRIGNDVNTDVVSVQFDGLTLSEDGGGIKKGYAYTLKLKFNSDRYTDVNNTTFPGNDSYATDVVIGGYRWKRLNLGATASAANADIPAANIHGAKYQWGANMEAGRYVSQATDQSTPGKISPWIQNALPISNWNNGSGGKGTNDPCGTNYKVPSRTDYATLHDNVAESGAIYKGTILGTNWDYAMFANYLTAIQLVSIRSKDIKMTLPAAGLRAFDGSILYRGGEGYYWTNDNTVDSNNKTTSYINFWEYGLTDPGEFPVFAVYPYYGYSVRCIRQ